MTPKMRNLKKFFLEQGSHIEQCRNDMQKSETKRWATFMRFSSECGDRHTSPSQTYYQCMHNAELGKKEVIQKNGITVCIPGNCSILKED